MILLLDEYDTPLQEAYVNGYWEEISDFIRKMFHASFKDNQNLERAVMTGITRVSRESVFSDLNYLKVVTVTSEKYATVFGFTGAEVFEALEAYGLQDRKQEVKEWYDGFRFGDCDNIYNPWSVLNFLDERRIDGYWVNTSSNQMIERLIGGSSSSVKQIVEDLISGGDFCASINENPVYDQLDQEENAVWSLLLASGYLKVKQCFADPEWGDVRYVLALTNKEVAGMFRNMVKNWFSGCSSSYHDFIKAMLRNDLEAMNGYMNRVALATFSIFDAGTKPSRAVEPERFYHGFFLGLSVGLSDQYRITSNRESGFGRYDVMSRTRRKRNTKRTDADMPYTEEKSGRKESIRKVSMTKKEHKISGIVSGSIADELEIRPGDILLSVNDTEIADVFDYHYQINEEYVTVVIRKPDGEEWEYEIEKDYEDDLGMEFENGMMDEYRSCCNHCIFCFIDQMPAGMRETLYFKDDDARLSFLQGNYVTLTNMKEADIDRIITYKLAPVNISVQTMNPQLRCEMLRNRFAGEALKKMHRLYEAGIAMNGQIVLCKGINDQKELERSIRELTEYIPHMQSVSVVPAGLTRYREGLYPLEMFTKQEAAAVVQMIHKWQQVCMERFGMHFVHASDEWYLLAGMELPAAESYDGYVQLENGVGMLRLLMDEFLEALGKEEGMVPDTDIKETVSIATGMLAAPFIRELAEAFMQRYPSKNVQVFAIRNDFFGEQITVAGLLTGQDLYHQLAGQDLGSRLLLPCSLLRSGEEVFLDDMTVQELKKALQVKIVIVNSNGQDLLDALSE